MVYISPRQLRNRSVLTTIHASTKTGIAFLDGRELRLMINPNRDSFNAPHGMFWARDRIVPLDESLHSSPRG